jgi:hypothetical protein
MPTLLFYKYRYNKIKSQMLGLTALHNSIRRESMNRTKKLMTVMAGLMLCVFIPASKIRADDLKDERLRVLESLLREQALQIKNLQAEIKTLKARLATATSMPDTATATSQPAIPKPPIAVNADIIRVSRTFYIANALAAIKKKHPGASYDELLRIFGGALSNDISAVFSDDPNGTASAVIDMKITVIAKQATQAKFYKWLQAIENNPPK